MQKQKKWYEELIEWYNSVPRGRRAKWICALALFVSMLWASVNMFVSAIFLWMFFNKFEEYVKFLMENKGKK